MSPDVADKVMLCAASKDDACRWYRMNVPATAIGYDQIVWSDGYQDSKGQTLIKWEHLLSLRSMIVQRPVHESVFQMVSTLHQHAKRPRIVVELDDDLWSLPTHNPAYEYYHAENRIKNLSRMVAMADRVVVSTEPLADAVRTHAAPREVVVVPNALPADFPWVPYDVEPIRRLVFSGGATHSRDVEHAFRSIRTILRSDNITATLIGSDYTSVLKGAQHYPWSKDVPAHYKRLARFAGAIGLAPLKADTFNQAKSAIRLMEYAAAGILPLVTPYGPYAGKPVAEVQDRELWKHAVRRTLALPDTTHREVMRMAQSWVRTRVITNYLDQWKDAWYL